MFMDSIGAYLGTIGGGTYSATKGTLESRRHCFLSYLAFLLFWPRARALTLTPIIFLVMVDCVQ